MTWTLPRQEPSLSSRKLKPPLESRRVRTQPCNVASRPTASTRRASATVILSIVVSCQGSLTLVLNQISPQPAVHARWDRSCPPPSPTDTMRERECALDEGDLSCLLIRRLSLFAAVIAALPFSIPSGRTGRQAFPRANRPVGPSARRRRLRRAARRPPRSFTRRDRPPRPRSWKRRAATTPKWRDGPARSWTNSNGVSTRRRPKKLSIW